MEFRFPDYANMPNWLKFANRDFSFRSKKAHQKTVPGLVDVVTVERTFPSLNHEPNFQQSVYHLWIEHEESAPHYKVPEIENLFILPVLEGLGNNQYFCHPSRN